MANGSSKIPGVDLLKAVKEKDVKKAAETLKRKPSLDYFLSTDKKKPLRIALDNKDEEMVKLLIDHVRKEKELLVMTYGIQEMIECILWDDIHGLDLLLKNDINPNQQSKEGRIPITEAINVGNLEMVILLWEHGADLTFVDENGFGPITMIKCKDNEFRRKFRQYTKIRV